MHSLTDTDKAMLDLAGTHYRYPAMREQHARERFGITATQYWQAVNQLINTRAALEHNPRLVLELRARRLRSAQGRTASSLAPKWLYESVPA